MSEGGRCGVTLPRACLSDRKGSGVFFETLCAG